MEEKVKKAIEVYQCSGCIKGHNTECYEKCDTGIGCGNHYAGTMMFPVVGKIFLGLPKGFNRLGRNNDDMKPYVFESYEKFKENFSGGYNHFNIPVWKHLDKNDNVIIRGLQPRLNAPFIHIILENCITEIDCFLITDMHLKEID